MSTDHEQVVPLPASRPEDVAAAERYISEHRMVLSGNRYQAKIAWSIVPLSDKEVRERVEAGGASPFRVLEIVRLDRLKTAAGAPYWAACAYLVLVEVKATIVG